ncbi:hypothetical protein ABMC89_13215 [Sulfitobacter sp. HNIBRBA3233]|uniref:hypothetical protein n=1 Tax=Sulfitobacter marinivivus TaxID=3158558 RepID=UPI0032DFB585
MKIPRISGLARACVALCMVAVIWPCAALAERPAAGLLWNRTGLPAVFPLLVVTAPGRDYVVELTDAETATPAMAGYIHGGRFFRLLVPPGRFDVTFHAGSGWAGEEMLFGPATQTMRLEKPLVFRVEDFRTKAGHRIDLRDWAPGERAGLQTRRIALCQTLRLAPEAPPALTLVPTGPDTEQSAGDAPKYGDLWRYRHVAQDRARWDVESRPC